MTDEYEFDCPDEEELHAGGFIDDSAEGWYHVQITEFIGRPTTKSGDPMNGFKIGLVALAANVEGQTGKSKQMLMNTPSDSHKDGGDFARRVLGCLFVATSLVKPGHKGAVDRSHLVGRQMVVHLKKNKDGYLNIQGCDIFHVDDPQVVAYPKDKKSLAKIPPELRKTGKPGDDGGTAGEPVGKPKPSPTGTTTDGVNLNDL